MGLFFFAKIGSATLMAVLWQRDQTSKEHSMINSGGALQTTSSILKPKVLVQGKDGKRSTASNSIKIVPELIDGAVVLISHSNCIAPKTIC